MGNCLLYILIGDKLLLHKRGGSVSLPYRDEADSFSIKGRECLSSLKRGGRLCLYEEERVFLFYIKRGERLLLYEEERVFLFFMKRGETPSL